MVMRLNIGSTTYSATPTGGLTFLADSKDGPTADPSVIAIQWSTEEATLPFFIHCEAANVGALKTLVDAQLAILDSPNMLVDVSVDNGDSSSKYCEFLTSDGTYRSRKCDTSVEWWSDTTAFIAARMRFSKVEDYPRGGGLGSGAVDVSQVDAQCERNVGGYLAVTLSSEFKPTTGSPGNTAMVNAKAWVTAILGRSSAPALLPWLPAKDVLRAVSNFSEVTEPNAANASTERVRATFILREVDDQLKAASDVIKAIDYDVAQTPQKLPYTFPQGAFEVSITGSFEYKVAGPTSFDSTDSAPGPISGANAATAINIVIAAAKTRQGWSEFVPIDSKLIHGGSQGVYGFQIAGIANGGQNPYLKVTEHIVKRESDSTFTDTDTGTDTQDPRKWSYGIGDKVKTILHRLEVVRVGSTLGYIKPGSIPDSFFARETSEDEQTAEKQVTLGYTGDGQTVYALSWEAIYEDGVGGPGRTGIPGFENVNNTGFGINKSLATSSLSDGTAQPKGG